MKGAMKGASVLCVASAVLASVGGTSPARAALDVGEAHELLDAWQLESARKAAERLLLEDPDNPRIWFLAGRVQHARGEHISALDLMTAAAREGVEGALELLPLVSSSAAYGASFETLESQHFRFRYLNKDEILAHYAKRVLEAAFKNITVDLGLPAHEQEEKIAVEIYPDARGLAGATGLTIDEIETSGTIAVCKYHRLMVTSPLATLSGYDWADTMAHEFVHLVISKKSHNTIPIWLHEGIAKYFESRWQGKAGMALSPYSEKLLADATRTGDFITYQQMHPSMAKLPSQDAAALAFAEVFTTIEYLVQKHGAETIPRLLAMTAQGMPLEKALRKVFGVGLLGIEKQWRRYLRGRKFKLVPGATPKKIRLANSEAEALQERPLEEIKDKEAHDFSRLGELLQLRGHHAAAAVEYEKALAKAGVRYSTLVYRLARAYQKLGKADKALGVISRSLQAHPTDGDTHLLAGRLHLSQNHLEQAQHHFEAARMQNPFNPEIHMALGALYAKQGNSALAAQEKRFLKLSRQPRPTREYTLPAPRAGTAKVSFITMPWTQIRLDAEGPVAAPAWELAMAPGKHTVEFHRGDGTLAAQSFEVAAGETKTLVLQ